MYTQLFFDDQFLLGREHLTRVYAQPELIGEYKDPMFSTDFPALSAFETADGKIRILYHGRRDDGGEGTFLAVSGDGVHFEPESTVSSLDLPGRIAPHQVLVTVPGQEVAAIVEDPFCDASERYKLLFTAENKEEFRMDGFVYVSPDLVHFRRIEGDAWNGGAEPVTSAFWNSVRNCFTVIRRPGWGDRRVGCTDTMDFRTFTPFELCVQEDCFDQPLDEVYGMNVLPYAGMFIGFPFLYTDNKSDHFVKFKGGNIYPQLAYSFDGHHFQRSLRSSYLKEYVGQPSMFWLSGLLPRKNGETLMYVTKAGGEHGTGFWHSTGGVISIYRARKDGFIALQTDDGEEGLLTTREYIWNGGEVSINLSASHATCAIYDESQSPVEGFGHGDCEPFRGDSTAWQPRFRGGSMNCLIGKTVSIEIRFTDGRLYSVSGDMQPMSYQQARRYRKLGKP